MPPGEEQREDVYIADRTAAHKFRLAISDNGIGYRSGQKPESFGMILIRGLSEDLGGDFSI